MCRLFASGPCRGARLVSRYATHAFMSEEQQYLVQAVPRIAEVDAADWDACAGDIDPFVSHAFLHALEESGSATAEEGWLPQHLVVADDDGGVLACAPMYVKGHSYGEYIFDWSWASAYRRAGREYYPKLQCCVPFTPAGGPRLLTRPGADREGATRVLVGAMIELAKRHEVSGVHITFCREEEQKICADLGMLPRFGIQYHWQNDGYASYDDFLGALLGRKRKALRKERRCASEAGLTIRRLSGDDIKAEHWDSFYEFYLRTIDTKYASPYLTRPFFDILGATMGDRVVLVVAEDQGRPVAGALNLLGGEALYGRYWGCSEQHRFLHFELCYHQAIEHAIELGLARVEAGAQGQHKIKRGYNPVPTYSAHWIAHPGFRDAISGFLDDERPAIHREIGALRELSIFSADRGQRGPKSAAE
jgi:predicted N-acyltransferase